MTLFAARDDAEADDVHDQPTMDVVRCSTWNVGGRTELELVSLPDGKRTPLRDAAGRSGLGQRHSRRKAIAWR